MGLGKGIVVAAGLSVATQMSLSPASQAYAPCCRKYKPWKSQPEKDGKHTGGFWATLTGRPADTDATFCSPALITSSCEQLEKKHSVHVMKLKMKGSSGLKNTNPLKGKTPAIWVSFVLCLCLNHRMSKSIHHSFHNSAFCRWGGWK